MKIEKGQKDTKNNDKVSKKPTDLGGMGHGAAIPIQKNTT